MEQPLVTVICLSYNHRDYVVEALDSIRRQRYPNIQWVIVDDASTDGTADVISDYLEQQKIGDCTYLPLSSNLGNCRAFNKGLAKAKGAFVIDLAADDVMMPDRVAKQIAFFQTLPSDYGVVYSDCWIVNGEGRRMHTYYSRDQNHHMVSKPPSGKIFVELLGPAFISSPTMMVRRAVFDELDGYDENLSYEDYDFWVRSGQKFRYAFQDEVLTEKRVLASGHHRGFYAGGGNPHLASTLVVCQKALAMVGQTTEARALAKTLRYHFRLAFFTENFGLAKDFYRLLIRLGHGTTNDRLIFQLARLNIRLNRFYIRYQGYREKRKNAKVDPD